MVFDFLKELHDRCQEYSSRIKFNPAFEADGVPVAYYCTLIEYTGTFIFLLSNEKRAGISSVFRSFLEAWVDFYNITDDPNRVSNYMFAHHKDWLKKLRFAKQGNPYFASIAKWEGLEGSLEHHKEGLRKLRKEKARSLSISEKFQNAGMVDEYQSIYGMECKEVHNDIITTLQRHISIEDDEAHITLYKEFSIDDYDARIDTVAALMVQATEILDGKLGNDNNDFVESLKSDLEQARASG